MANTNGKNGRDFSIELNSNQNLTRLQTSSNGSGVLVEGTLGDLEHAVFVEPEILEVRGSCGVLRVNLRSNEVREKKVDGGDKE